MAYELQFTNVTKSFTISRKADAIAIKNVSFAVRPGEFFVLLGLSGSGKSTILRLASGLLTPDSGQVLHSGFTKQDIGFVFQDFALLPWLTVEQNVELPLLSRHLTEVERVRRVAKVLRDMGLGRYKKNRINELSGGMRQRVGIARALVVRPKIIFMDEPFSELDSYTAALLRQEVLDIWRTQHVTIVFVTHNIEEAVLMADRVAILSAHPGYIEKTLTIPLARPRRPRSSEFYANVDKLTRLVQTAAKKIKQ